ncbi:hypothetical protein H7Q97_06450 [Ochrobactrum sp. CM-21-5]|nr:hypothetical protein [Ochrobactrum sp. CM-21-5]MBC2885041.1 hypothetical protein [Ochrobactrum sp. CM-21-5]
MSFLPAWMRKPRAPDKALMAAVLAAMRLPDDTGFVETGSAVFTRNGLAAIAVFRLEMVSLA